MEAEHQGVVKGWRKRYVLSSCYYLKPRHRRRGWPREIISPRLGR